MSYFFWSKKVSPLKQINAEQLRNLTECLIKYCQDHGNKIHSGTFVLCTGQTNLLEAVEQTYTGNMIKQIIYTHAHMISYIIYIISYIILRKK